MNRREMLQAGLGIAAGVVISQVSSPSAAGSAVTVDFAEMSPFTMVSYVGADGIWKSTRIPDAAPRYVMVSDQALLGSDCPYGPFAEIQS